MDDKTALEDMRQGGETGIETLFRRYRLKLKYLLLKKYNSLTPDNADDICQETFLQFHQKINTFEEKCSVIRWLFRIAQNKIIDDLRRKAPKTEDLPLKLPDEEEEDESEDEYFFEIDEQEEKRLCYAECISNALKKLGPNYSDCLTTLIFSFPKPSIDKIANEIGITHKEAKVLLDRCKKKFKESQNCLMALILFYVLGLSQKELAEMLDKKENAIGVFLSNCRKKLKNDTNFRKCCEECGYLLPKE